MELFGQMQHEGMQPNSIIFLGLLNACADMVVFEKGRCVHV
jgi:hypothetical protein